MKDSKMDKEETVLAATAFNVQQEIDDLERRS
jgi:hypothetical protein